MGKPTAHDIDDDDDTAIAESNLDDDTVDLDPDAEGGADEDRGDNLDDDQADEDTDEDEDADDEGERDPPAGQVNTDDIPAELLEEIIGKGGKVPAMVPYARLAEVVSQNKQLVNALLERGHSVPGQEPKEEAPPAFDMKAAMREKNKAIMEGDEDAALEWEEKIEAERQRVADERALQVLNNQRAYESAQDAANRVVAAYPQLQDDSDQYDEEVLQDIVALRDTYIARGMKSAEAIEKAAKRLLGDPPSAEDDAGDPDPEAKRKKLAKDKVLRNAQAAKRQPPPIGKRGDASPKHGAEADMDPSEPSEEEWDALPEKEKARLRGDYVD